MNRRIWTGVVAGVLGAVVLLTVGVGAYRAGQRDDAVTWVVTEDESGEVVRVVNDHGFRPGPGFILIPLLVILLIAWLVWSRGRGHGWHGHGYGPGWGHGHGYGPGYRSSWLDEWHRQAHEAEGAEGQGPQDESPPPQGAPPTAGAS